nr:uncharacterized protein LOC106679391 [Halyomorpha halys]
MLRLLLLAFAFRQVVAHNSLNVTANEFIVKLNNAVVNGGSNKIPIENLSVHMRKFIFPGTMNCYNGWAESLGSLKRVGDVKIIRYKKIRAYIIPVYLESLEFGYEHCDVKMIHFFNWKGNVRATVETNVIKAIVTMKKDETACLATFDGIYVTKIGKINVTTGGKVPHGILAKVAEQVRGQMDNDIIEKINDKLQAIAPLAFSSSEFCSIEE